MDLIYKTAPDYLTNDIWVAPTERERILELDECGNIHISENIPIIRVLATPSIFKTISRLIYIIKDKMVLINSTNTGDDRNNKNNKNNTNNINNGNNTNNTNNTNKTSMNLIKYLDKTYFKTPSKNYYKAKKAWYRFIGDLFKDISNKDFKKTINKTIFLLKLLNPILVLDVHDVSKWNHISGFQKFVKILHNKGISIVLRCPIESINHVKRTFENSKINNIAIIKYYGTLSNHHISSKVAEYLLKISNGNLNIIKTILQHTKRDLKTLRDLKIPWLKIMPKIVPKKYYKIVKAICSLKKFKITELAMLSSLNLKLPTLYTYLSDLTDMGILKKRRIGKTIIYKLNMDKDNLMEIFKNMPYIDLYHAIFTKSFEKRDTIYWFSVFRTT